LEEVAGEVSFQFIALLNDFFVLVEKICEISRISELETNVGSSEASIEIVLNLM
jgi:hypothetical protein